MRTRDETTSTKLRGGFYTPPRLVSLTLQRAHTLSAKLPQQLSILEPSAGDGAFLEGLASSELANRIQHITAVEALESEVIKCITRSNSAGLNVKVVHADFLQWQGVQDRCFDIAIGNPPFVRFQFVSESSKRQASRLSSELGLPGRKVSNLWIYVFLGAVSALRHGGVFAFVVPSESFTGVSAHVVRQWLVRNCENITLDLFPPGSFPNVLQEVVILSGRRVSAPTTSKSLAFRDYGSGGLEWSHHVDPEAKTWTGYLLRSDEIDALNETRTISQVKRLSTIAKFDAAAVTGANSFFSISEDVVKKYDLKAWTVPLLPRIRQAQGLVHSSQDQERLQKEGHACSLLDFGSNRPDPLTHAGAAAYLRTGETAGIHLRYKTRIRQPWFRIPHIRPGQLMLSKRSHWYPRAIVNDAAVVTTDTIYRGRIVQNLISVSDFAAIFHNSLTLLSAEIEGRSFGGGVLELVPSEIDRLMVPVVPGFGSKLSRFDKIFRNSLPHESDALVTVTNAGLRAAKPEFTTDLLDRLEVARKRLLHRRLVRNERPSWEAVA